MKKLLLMFPLLLMTACGAPKVDMDQLSSDNRYHYENFDLKFALDLPPEFIYYQTQRKDGDGFVDIEFFVPTNDPMYVDEAVPSYAMPLVVRVYGKEEWSALGTSTPSGFALAAEGEDRAYLLEFWDRLPRDWEGKWNEGMREGIKESFKVK